jgi:3-deoxy-D-manno-octulosonate 8-phosphate phosphatase (KDO 8-P phosphatase)
MQALKALTPALHYPPELLLQAQGIRVAFFDIDGVLTDGGLYFSEAGEFTHARFGTEDKRPAAEAFLSELNLSWAQAAAMGDDWPDLPVMQRVAFACAPANGHAQAKNLAHHITTERGGEGAARAFCDLLLVAGGHYARLLAEVGISAHTGASA